METPWVTSIQTQKKFFETATAVFEEEDSAFQPNDEMYTVAATVAHVAITYDWFVNGAFSSDGFDLDFEADIAKAKAVTSLTEARGMFEAATSRAMDTLGGKRLDEMMAPIVEGPILGGAPRLAILEGLADHTAHHRGALAVYARLLKKNPPMPYG